MPALSLLIKPASGNCDMRCKYCFYVDEMDNRSVANLGIMNESTLRNVLEKSFEYADHSCNIAFQGGEPTLAGIEYFKKCIELIEELNTKECTVNYAIQTNGYRLDEEWCEFFKVHNFLVGISLDGNKEVHDKYRIDARGEGTFDRVMASVELLKKHEVDFNILTVVHAETVKYTNKTYNFFKRNQFGYQQYIECLDPIGEEAGQQEYSLTPEGYGEFLVSLFKKYYRDMSEGRYVYNRYFENLMAIMMRQQPESCAMGGRCGDYITVEADGSAYPCDFYVLDQWKLGNFNEDNIEDMAQRRLELGFVEFSKHIPEECKVCKWFPLCRNGCRRNCEQVGVDHRTVNYFCPSYKKFFEYAYPYLEELYRRYQGGR
ncbi:MAG: anaerobic sulfatase maturase [Eubacteriales bacterium]